MREMLLRFVAQLAPVAIVEAQIPDPIFLTSFVGIRYLPQQLRADRSPMLPLRVRHPIVNHEFAVPRCLQHELQPETTEYV